MKTLLVDDDHIQRRLYEKIFERHGFELDVSCCQEALLLDWSKYDTVLVDVMMPDIAGHDLIRSVAQRIGMRNMPHVVLFSVLDAGRLAELATGLHDDGIEAGYQTKFNGHAITMQNLLGIINDGHKNSTR